MLLCWFFVGHPVSLCSVFITLFHFPINIMKYCGHPQLICKETETQGSEELAFWLMVL